MSSFGLKVDYSIITLIFTPTITNLIFFYNVLEPDRSNYWILNTDYTGFSIIVSCRPTEENKSIEAYWLLSRDQTISEEGRRIADAVVDSKLDKNRIRKTVQDHEK